MDTVEAITSRMSTRAFTQEDVPDNIIKDILNAAKCAPSGVNIQPWHVHVLKGKSKDKLSQALLEQRENEVPSNQDFQYYPLEWFEPYKSRRKACGKALYGALDIEYGDTKKRLVQWNKNYHFFGAPVGFIFTIDAKLEVGSWLDTGMFIQTVMIAARHFNLHTCPLASIGEYPDTIREVLKISQDNKIICGMALGYADETDPVNQYRTNRESLEILSTWHS